MHLNTTEALRSHMASVSGEAVSDDDLIWFVCWCNASMIFSSGSVKDLASIFQEGTSPTLLPDVQDWIDTNFEESDEEDEESMEYGDDNIKELVNNFYGK